MTLQKRHAGLDYRLVVHFQYPAKRGKMCLPAFLFRNKKTPCHAGRIVVFVGVSKPAFLFPTSMNALYACKAAGFTAGESRYWDAFDALQYGIKSVPTLVVNKSLIISGTQPLDRIVDVLASGEWLNIAETFNRVSDSNTIGISFWMGIGEVTPEQREQFVQT